MKTLADASVLIFFAKLGKLDLLLKIFSNLSVTSIVLSEIMAGKEKGFLECLEVQKKINSKQIRKIKISKKFDSGEDSTIFAAKKHKAIVLMDDYRGIKKAEFEGLVSYSCPYILLKALKEKLISKKEFDQLLDKILSYNYYISPRLLKEIIEISSRIANAEKISPKELTGMISDLKYSSLEAQKKAVELFGEPD